MKISKLLQLTVIAFFLIAAFSIGPMPTFADESKYTVEIIDYGICDSNRTNTFQNNQNVVKSHDVKSYKINSQTEKIEGKLGVKFGIIFKVNGPSKPKKVPGQAIIIYPKTLINPKTGKSSDKAFFNYTFNFTNEDWYSGYSFDNDWEIIPGVWTFEIWVDGQKLAEKSFTVTVP